MKALQGQSRPRHEGALKESFGGVGLHVGYPRGDSGLLACDVDDMYVLG